MRLTKSISVFAPVAMVPAIALNAFAVNFNADDLKEAQANNWITASVHSTDVDILDTSKVRAKIIDAGYTKFILTIPQNSNQLWLATEIDASVNGNPFVFQIAPQYHWDKAILGIPGMDITAIVVAYASAASGYAKANAASQSTTGTNVEWYQPLWSWEIGTAIAGIFARHATNWSFKPHYLLKDLPAPNPTGKTFVPIQ